MRRTRTGKLAVVVAMVVAWLVATAAAAGAHPLGNFTVNRYARVEVSRGVVRVYYVLDEAEIPAFQDRDAVAAGRDAFANERLAQIESNLSLTIDGSPVHLDARRHLLSQPPGQGGLPTLRLAAVLEAPVQDGPDMQLAFVDGNEPDRIGWREVVVSARGGASVLTRGAPMHDGSDELRHYPVDPTRAPLDVRSVAFSFRPGDHAVAALPLSSPTVATPRAEGRFASLVRRAHVTPLALLGMLALAALFGAAHALAPGHGKTVMAAYLVGTRGRRRDAIALGVIVSAMHTASVLVLGLVLLHLSRSASLDHVYPWLKLASGVMVAGLGLALLRRRLVARADARSHADAHDHGHPHGGHHHHHGPGGHSHEVPDGVAPLSWRGLAVLATVGGLFPSPSALVVLVSSFSLGRATLGLGLIAAFSVGLATTLTGVGLALVSARDLAVRRPALARAMPLLPVLGAAAVTAIGSVLLLQGLAGVGAT